MNYIRTAMQSLPGHWHKGDIGDGRGNYCGLGHLEQAVGMVSKPEYMTGCSLMSKVAEEQYSDRLGASDGDLVPFAEFNDHPETTEAEVLMVMEKAAILWDETNG